MTGLSPLSGGRAVAALVLACAFLLLGAGVHGVAHAQAAQTQTVVSIEFDDGVNDQYVARSLLSSHGMHGTFYVNSGHVGSPNNMSWSQLHDLANDGNEIGGHTVDHFHLPQLSNGEAMREICNDRNTLLSQGFSPTNFAYPFGDFNATTQQQVAQCGYNTGRDVSGVVSPGTCNGCDFAESIPPQDPYRTRTPENIQTTTSLATMQGYVTQAEQHGGGWVQLVFHHICNGCDSYSVTQADFTSLLDWLQPRAASGTVVKTVQDVIGGPLRPAVQAPVADPMPGPNLLHNASFEDDANADGTPDCYDLSAFGTSTGSFTRSTDARSGNFAERIDVTAYTSGARRVLTHMDLGDCSPAANVGDNYQVSAYYKSTSAPLFYLYTRDSAGAWNFWITSPAYAASSSWSKAVWTTPPVPPGTTAVSFGLGLPQTGSLTVDDESLIDRGVLPAPDNVLQNASLETVPTAGADPTCWSRTTYTGPTGTGSWADVTDTHTGTHAQQATIANYSSGDIKLVSQQDSVAANPVISSATAAASGGSLNAGTYYYVITGTNARGETIASNEVSATTAGSTGSVTLSWAAARGATGYRIYRSSTSGSETLLASVGSVTSYTDTGASTPGTTSPPTTNTALRVAPCAPTATAGHAYQASTWYKTSAGASARFVIYYRDAAGNWVFWKASPIPASTTWTQISTLTDPVPAGATALSMGVSLLSSGTLTADDLAIGDYTLSPAANPVGSDDFVPPTSSATSPAYANSQSMAIPYTATDNAGGSGVARVDLYAKAPGALGYTKVGSDTNPGTTGSISYLGTADGTYSFYTVAIDNAGNVESSPSTAQSTTVLDTVLPTSTASAPANSSSSNLKIAYTASDGSSGVAQVDLYAKGPSDVAYSKVNSVTVSPTAGQSTSGTFDYAAPSDGSYSFYTVATDRAGNSGTTPSGPQATVTVDTAAPSSTASVADTTSTSSSLNVSYTASDAGAGLAEVDLYAKGPGDSTYAKVASASGSATSGSFAYTAPADGTYRFYTVATDAVGNQETAPSAAQATVVVDTLAPSSQASVSSTVTRDATWNLTFSASDSGTGVARVDLYVKAPGASDYTKVDSSTSNGGSFSYTAGAGDGVYGFYTVATDAAGNRETAPAAAQANVMLDSTNPSSQASAPSPVATHSVPVSYTAHDSGSGIAQVDLYAKGPGDADYSKVDSKATSATSGSFSYTTPVDGTYSFYTVATDVAGNQESAPGSAQATVVVDTSGPSSEASVPAATSSSTSLTVNYTASGSAFPVTQVDLYVKGPGDSGYNKVDSTSSSATRGSFTYTAATAGSYSFYTVATDQGGHQEPAPTSADATVLVDQTAPTSQASAPATAVYGPVKVSYTAADAGSGVARVDLYAKGPSDTGYAKVDSVSSSAASGSLSYTPTGANGTYSFYTLATDVAGNTEPAPATADTTMKYTRDAAAPATAATAPTYSTGTRYTVSYTASDTGGAGVASVELWVRAPGSTSFAKAATDGTPGASGSFSYTAAGDGAYAVYTVGVDKAGNREAAPATADATTTVDTTAPAAFTMTDPGPYMSANESLTVSSAPSDGGSGVASVKYQWAPSGSTTWTDACTATAAPWSCNWNTSTKATPDGAYALRAVAADKAGNTAVASNAPLTDRLDNTRPTAQSIQTTNGGTTAGKVEAGDAVTLTYSETISAGSILAGWNGASTAVRVKINDSNGGDKLEVWKADGSTRLAVTNPLALGGDYVPAGGAVLNGTMVQNGSAVAVTLGTTISGSTNAAAVATPGTLSWTPDAGATDLAGNKVMNTAVTKAGPAF